MLPSTTGGSGGTSTTVTTLDELIAAVEGTDAKIVIIDGTITGNEVVRVGSNTSVLGNPGASKWHLEIQFERKCLYAHSFSALWCWAPRLPGK